MSSNLPPGVTESMIPGNRPEDQEWENLEQEIYDSGLDADAARRRWESQPELLEALEMIVEDHEFTKDKPGFGCREEAYVETARAAIAKAKGES